MNSKIKVVSKEISFLSLKKPPDSQRVIDRVDQFVSDVQVLPSCCRKEDWECKISEIRELRELVLGQVERRVGKNGLVVKTAILQYNELTLRRHFSHIDVDFLSENDACHSRANIESLVFIHRICADCQILNLKDKMGSMFNVTFGICFDQDS